MRNDARAKASGGLARFGELTAFPALLDVGFLRLPPSRILHLVIGTGLSGSLDPVLQEAIARAIVNVLYCLIIGTKSLLRRAARMADPSGWCLDPIASRGKPQPFENHP
jgi:hypothetical protein